MSLNEFITPREKLLTDDSLTEFHEWETENQTFVNCGIATRICHFKKKGILNGQPYDGQGEKHIQLVFSNQSWKIASVIWQDQT